MKRRNKDVLCAFIVAPADQKSKENICRNSCQNVEKRRRHLCDLHKWRQNVKEYGNGKIPGSHAVYENNKYQNLGEGNQILYHLCGDNETCH